MNFKFDRKTSSFFLLEQNKKRIVFDDLTVKLRFTSISLKDGRITPLGVDDESFALSQRFIGGNTDYRMGQCSAFLRYKILGSSLLITYDSVSKEAFSPEEAVKLTVSDIPGVDGSVFYHNRSDDFQNFDCEGLWWSQAIFLKDPARETKNDWGLFALWKYEDGRIAGILPVTTEKVFGKLCGSSRKCLSTVASTTSYEVQTDSYPLLLVSFADNVETVVDNIFQAYVKINPNLPLLTEKKIGKPFDKLGWCSWNAFGKDCTEQDIVSAIKKFKENNLPIKYVIIDDCWQDITIEKVVKHDEGFSNARLVSIDCSKEKFPSGMKQIVKTCKKAGIESVGLWHALNGYWQGIDSECSLAKEFPEWFIVISNGTLVPKPGSAFFDIWYKLLRSWGVDFVKIDNQGFHRQHLPYQKSFCEYMSNLQRDIKDAMVTHELRAIYCMATHPENIFNAMPDQILRVTNDFIPNNVYGTRKHIVNNFYNSAWLDKLLWPDFDMFQSSDMNSLAFAHSLAISASPIYTTDKPVDIKSDLLRRLVLPSGLIPRYDIPARLLDSRFFQNPFEDGNVMVVKARSGHAVSVGIFNVTSSGVAVFGRITLEELGLSEDRYLAYSDSAKFEPQIVKRGGYISYFLKNIESDLVTLAPVRKGFAVIGLIDYFAAPALVSKIIVNKKSCVLKLKASGQILYYSDLNGIITADVEKNCEIK